MTDNGSNTEYQPPSVKRWGTVLDLTAGGQQGCSGDTFYDNPQSIESNGEGVAACGDK